MLHRSMISIDKEICAPSCCAMQQSGMPAMAKAASSSLPEIKLATFDLDALFARQKASLATLHEVQNVLVETAQAIARAQYGWFEESLAGARTALSWKEPRMPETALAAKALAVTKQSIELAVAAQRRIGALLVQSGRSNTAALDLPAAA
jgi:hypothetical protein